MRDVTSASIYSYFLRINKAKCILLKRAEKQNYEYMYYAVKYMSHLSNPWHSSQSTSAREARQRGSNAILDHLEDYVINNV